MKMSPNEEKISLMKYPETETDCNVTKRNGLTNSETLKNHEMTIQKNDESATKIEYVPRIRWLDLSAQIFIHAGFLYGLYLVFTQAKLLTTLFGKANFLVIRVCLFYCTNFRGFSIYNRNIDFMKRILWNKHFLYIFLYNFIILI